MSHGGQLSVHKQHLRLPLKDGRPRCPKCSRAPQKLYYSMLSETSRNHTYEAVEKVFYCRMCDLVVKK